MGATDAQSGLGVHGVPSFWGEKEKRLAFAERSRPGTVRSTGRSAPKASPADASRRTDPAEAQTFPDKHRRPSARLHRSLMRSDSS